MFLIFEDFLTDKYCIFLAFVLAQVVQKLDSAIHRINHYPADTYYGKQLRSTLDSDLSRWIALSNVWTTGAWRLRVRTGRPDRSFLKRNVWMTNV